MIITPAIHWLDTTEKNTKEDGLKKRQLERQCMLYLTCTKPTASYTTIGLIMITTCLIVPSRVTQKRSCLDGSALFKPVRDRWWQYSTLGQRTWRLSTSRKELQQLFRPTSEEPLRRWRSTLPPSISHITS